VAGAGQRQQTREEGDAHPGCSHHDLRQAVGYACRWLYT
jgi:hypothetical protein